MLLSKIMTVPLQIVSYNLKCYYLRIPMNEKSWKLLLEKPRLAQRLGDVLKLFDQSFPQPAVVNVCPREEEIRAKEILFNTSSQRPWQSIIRHVKLICIYTDGSRLLVKLLL